MMTETIKELPQSNVTVHITKDSEVIMSQPLSLQQFMGKGRSLRYGNILFSTCILLSTLNILF